MIKIEIKPIVNEDFIVIKEDATVSEMIGQMKQFEKRSGLVFRNKKYLGLIEKKRLLRSRIDTKTTKIKNFVQKTPILNENADVIESAYLMFQSNLDFLPVERNKQIVGVLKGLQLATLATTLPEAKGLKIDDVKLTKGVKVLKDNPISKAIDVMYKKRVDHVPVFEQGRLFGMITYKDLLRRYLNWSPKRNFSAKFNKIARSKGAEADMPNLASLPVSSFSTNDNLLIIDEGKSLKEAVIRMARNNISDLVVMKGDEFKGLLTVKNILRRIGSLKIPKNFNIRFVGLNDVQLDTYQKYNVQKITSNEAFKLQRQLHNESFNLTLHLKEYEKEGKRHKYSVTLRIEFPSQIITSTQDDWDVETALRKTFNNAKNKVKKKFHGDSGWKKYYG